MNLSLKRLARLFLFLSVPLGAAVVITYFIINYYILNNKISSKDASKFIEIFIFLLLCVLWNTGLRCALHYIPRPQRLRQAGLLDWRGVLFGSGLVLACIFIIAADWLFLSVESGWPIFWLLCVAGIVLYWKPAKAWQQKPEPAYLLAAVAILASGAGFVLFTLFILSSTPLFTLESRSNIQNIHRIFFVISLVLALGCGLVALLPLFQSLIRDKWPRRGNQLQQDSMTIALLSVPSILWMYWFQQVDPATYVIFTGGFILLVAYFLTPWLSTLSNWRWLVVMAVLIAILGFVAIITSQQWSQFFGIYAWNGFLLTLFLHVVLSASLALLMHWPSLFRGILSFLLLITLGLVFVNNTWDIKDTGQAIAYVWLVLFATGWLLAPFFPSQIEAWRVFLFSGVLQLLLTPFLLPISFHEPELVTYHRPLPAWASQHISKELLNTGFPGVLVWSLSILLFAGFVRSGRTVLARSRTPKPEMVLVGVLLLGVFLALSSSHHLSPEVVVHRLVNGTWGAVALPGALDGEVSLLFSDRTGTVWVGVGDSSVARFNGQWRTYQPQEGRLSLGKVKTIYQNQEGYVWVVTEQGLTKFAPNVDEPRQIYNFVDLNLPKDTSINVTYQDSKHIHWVGTTNGLLRLEDRKIIKIPPEEKFVNSSDTRLRLEDEKINDFKCDEIDTVNSNINYYIENENTYFEKAEIQQIGQDPAGRLWVATNHTLYISSSLIDNQELQFYKCKGWYDGRSIFTWKNSQNEIYYYIPRTPPSGNVYKFNDKYLKKTCTGLGAFTCNRLLMIKFHNSSDRTWGFSENYTLFSNDGNSWNSISKLGLPEIRSVSAIEEHNGTLWFAGQAQTGIDGAWRYVIAEYNPQIDTNSFQKIYDLDSGLATGEIKDLVVDYDGNIWALIEQQSYTPNSVLWFVLPVLLFAGLGYREYNGQSLTQAQRLSRQLRATPERTMALLYRQLQDVRQGGEVLAHLADERSLIGSAECSKLAGALVMLAPDQPVPGSDALGTLARELTSASEMPDAAELGGVLWLFG